MMHPQEITKELNEVSCEVHKKALKTIQEIKDYVKANELDPDIFTYAKMPEINLSHNKSITLNNITKCLHWHSELTSALHLCDTHAVKTAVKYLEYVCVKSAVKYLVHACRDLLVVQAQFLCDIGNRNAFEKIIDEAHGTTIPRSSPLYACIMNAYQKTLRRLPGMFQSRNKQLRPHRRGRKKSHDRRN